MPVLSQMCRYVKFLCSFNAYKYKEKLVIWQSIGIIVKNVRNKGGHLHLQIF